MNESYDNLEKLWQETKDTQLGNTILKSIIDSFKEIAKSQLLDKYGDIILRN